MSHLHITGCRRSGTTLLFEMLAACCETNVSPIHEQSLFDCPHIPRDQTYLSKKPSDITHAYRVFLRNPNLHLIYIQRDPRDVITSRHPTRSDIYYASFSRWQRYQQAAQQFEGHPRFLKVRYESLVTHPNEVQQEILQQFNFLVTQHTFEAFHERANPSKQAEISLNGLRAVNPNSIGNWRQHLPRIKFQSEQYPALAQAVRMHGYEPDDNWLRSLDNVQPLSQRYGEDHPGLIKRWETHLRFRLKSRTYLRRQGF